MSKKADFEIGDQVVFGKKHYIYDTVSRWKTGRITDTAAGLVELEFRSVFGFLRRMWLQPAIGYSIKRKERAEELLAKYTTPP